MSVVVFDIVVMGLVKDSRGIMIAIGVLVPNPSHLVHNLGLGSVWSQRYLILPTELW